MHGTAGDTGGLKYANCTFSTERGIYKMAVAIIYAKSGGVRRLTPPVCQEQSCCWTAIIPAWCSTISSDLVWRYINPVGSRLFQTFEAAVNANKYETLILDNGTDLIDRWLLELGRMERIEAIQPSRTIRRSTMASSGLCGRRPWQAATSF